MTIGYSGLGRGKDTMADERSYLIGQTMDILRRRYCRTRRVR